MPLSLNDINLIDSFKFKKSDFVESDGFMCELTVDEVIAALLLVPPPPLYANEGKGICIKPKNRC